LKDFLPRIDAVRDLKKRLQAHLVETPVVRCAAIEDILGGGTRVTAKMEFLQQTGTFKARGALSVAMSLDEHQRAAGITAVSAGNHAVAAAFAAREVGTTAKVVMISSANPLRIEKCLAYGAEVVMAGDAHEAFAKAEHIQKEEGRYLIHPF
jgi:threonine dehydratase